MHVLKLYLKKNALKRETARLSVDIFSLFKNSQTVRDKIQESRVRTSLLVVKTLFNIVECPFFDKYLMFLPSKRLHQQRKTWLSCHGHTSYRYAVFAI